MNTQKGYITVYKESELSEEFQKVRLTFKRFATELLNKPIAEEPAWLTEIRKQSESVRPIYEEPFTSVTLDTGSVGGEFASLNLAAFQQKVLGISDDEIPTEGFDSFQDFRQALLDEEEPTEESTR